MNKRKNECLRWFPDLNATEGKKMKLNKYISRTYYVPGTVPAGKRSRNEQERTVISRPSLNQKFQMFT